MKILIDEMPKTPNDCIFCEGYVPGKYHPETKEYDKGSYRCLLNPFEECRKVCTMGFITCGVTPLPLGMGSVNPIKNGNSR